MNAPTPMVIALTKATFYKEVYFSEVPQPQ